MDAKEKPATAADFGELATVAGMEQGALPFDDDSTALSAFDAESIRTVERCRAWVAANPEPYGYMRSRALELAARKRHFSARRLFEEARDECNAENGRGVFKCPNEYCPILIRMVVAECPQVEPYVDMRKSRYDRWV